MRLSEKAIEEFKLIHKTQFGVDLSEDEAQEMGIRLLRVIDLVYQPLPDDHQCEACANDTPPVDSSL